MTTFAHEKELYDLVWEPTVTALSQTFQNGLRLAKLIFRKKNLCLSKYQSSQTLSLQKQTMDIQKTVAGFKKCSILADRFQMSEIFDKILIDLGRFSYLLPKTSDICYITGKQIKAKNNKPVKSLEVEQPSVDSVLNQNSITENNTQNSLDGSELNTQQSINSNKSLQIESEQQINEDFSVLTFHAVEMCEQKVLKLANSEKAQIALKAMFSIVKKHGNSLSCKHGWRHFLEVYLPLYRAQVFPDDSILTHSVDFTSEDGFTPVIPELKLRRKHLDQANQGFFSSIFGGPSNIDGRDGSKLLSLEQINKLNELQKNSIPDLELDSIVSDSRFLRLESLVDLTKAIINLGSNKGQEASLFYLELFIQIILKNKDRAGALWQYVRHYFASIIHNSLEGPNLLIERACTGLIRIAIRLGPCSPPVAKIGFQTLQLILLIPPEIMVNLQKTITIGLKELRVFSIKL